MCREEFDVPTSQAQVLADAQSGTSENRSVYKLCAGRSVAKQGHKCGLWDKSRCLANGI